MVQQETNVILETERLILRTWSEGDRKCNIDSALIGFSVCYR